MNVSSSGSSANHMTEDLKSIWLERYKSAQVLEKNLKDLSHQAGASGVANARDRCKEEYEALILSDIVLAQAKEIESALWKNVFYIVIDGYRRKLAILGKTENENPRQQKGQGRGGNSHHGNNNNNSSNNNGRGQKPPVPSIEFRKTSTKFRAFLQEATGFYHRLIQNLAACYDVNEIESSLQTFSLDGKHVEVSDAARQAAISSCHKCYIFLGDLARYRQTYNDLARKNWSSARDYYNKARNLLPSSGNPYNQLAVIATFTPNNFLALYFYYRSLAVRLPFMTARNNIKVLIQKMSTDQDRTKKFVREERLNDRSAANAKDRTLLNDFLAKFVLLHGALFLRSTGELEMDLLQDSLGQLFKDYLIDPELLLKVQIINMASHYTMCYIPFQDDDTAFTRDQQLAAERKALRLITNTFATILHQATTLLEHHRNGGSRSSGRPADFLPSNVLRAMPVLRLSLKWFQVNIHLVKRLSEGLVGEEKDNLMLEQIWEDLALFLSLLADVYTYDADTIFCRDVLKEDAELQGFAALRRAIDERPLSIIPPSRISPKAEMQLRVSDMFQDALTLAKDDWTELYAQKVEKEDGQQGLLFVSDPDELEEEGEEDEEGQGDDFEDEDEDEVHSEDLTSEDDLDSRDGNEYEGHDDDWQG